MNSPIYRGLLCVGLLTMTGFSRAADLELEPHFGISSGYRRDSLQWTVAGTPQGTDPNILSELTWKNLAMNQIQGHVELEIAKILLLKGEGYYGWIFSGNNQDSDYLFDNRQGEFSRSVSDTAGDHVLGGSLAGGVPWHCSAALALIPLAGYAWDNQNLRDANGVQKIPDLGPFGGLDSTYDARWKGPWLGFDVNWDATDSLKFLGSFAYHFVSYHAEADWNLRSDLQHPVSFSHEADGHGVGGSGEVAYQLLEGWWLGLRGEVKDMRAEDGTDTSFTTDPTTPTISTRLNEVHWTSWSIMATFTKRWGSSSSSENLKTGNPPRI